MMGLNILACLALLGSAAPLSASQNSASAGVSHWMGALSSGARGTAMAGALGADSGSLDSLGSNPAGLAGMTQAQASFTHNLWIMDSSSDHLAFGYSPFEHAGFALGLDYLDFGSVDLYSIDSSGMPKPEGQAQPSAYNANLNWGQALGLGLDFGATGKWLNQNLNGQSSSAFAADLGLRWSSPWSGLDFGLSFLNFGGQLFGAPLPSETRLGLAYGLRNLDLALDLSWLPADQSGPLALLGVEYKPLDFLAIRGGYRQGGISSPSGPALGLGLSLGWARLDYAYNMAGAFSNTQQFSLTALFPQPRAASALAPSAPANAPADESPDALASGLIQALKNQGELQKRMKAMMEKMTLQGMPGETHEASKEVREQGLKPAVFQGDFEAAARDARAMIALEPDNADGYMALGILDWHLQKVDDCLANLRKALALDPSRDYLKAIIQRTEKSGR